MNSSLQVNEFAHRIALIREGKPVTPPDLHQVIRALNEKKVSQNLVLNLIESRGLLRLTKFLEDRSSKLIRKISAKLIWELLYNNIKGQVTFSERYGYSCFEGINTINDMPKGMIDYLKRNPSAFSTLKNMDKYFKQKEMRRTEDSLHYWCFPPMRNRTSSEKRKHRENKHQEILNSQQENLEESNLDGIDQINLQLDLEEEYLDFPDPLEYLIGFFCTKEEKFYKHKARTYQNKAVNMTASPKKKPQTSTNNYIDEAEPKVLYKSYYDWKRPSRPTNESSVVNTPGTIKHSNKFKQQALLNHSYEKEEELLSKPKNTIQFPKKFTNTLDDDNRLCRTLGEESQYDSIHGSSVDRNSLERYSVVHHPSFDPYISSRSYNYDHSSSFTKDRTSYLQNNLLKGSNQSSKNSYNGIAQSLNYDASPSVALNSKLMTYSNSNSARAESSINKDKESSEREPLYAGVISAGSGSVSSTKIK